MHGFINMMWEKIHDMCVYFMYHVLPLVQENSFLHCSDFHREKPMCDYDAKIIPTPVGHRGLLSM